MRKAALLHGPLSKCEGCDRGLRAACRVGVVGRETGTALRPLTYALTLEKGALTLLLLHVFLEPRRKFVLLQMVNIQ